MQRSFGATLRFTGGTENTVPRQGTGREAEVDLMRGVFPEIFSFFGLGRACTFFPWRRGPTTRGRIGRLGSRQVAARTWRP